LATGWSVIDSRYFQVACEVLRYYRIILRVVYNTGAFGGIVIYSFMALNFYSITGNEKMITTKIIKSGSLAKGRHGCSHPYVIVEIIDRTKQVVLPCDFEIGDSNFAKLPSERDCLDLI
jgi:hypothetical protein